MRLPKGKLRRFLGQLSSRERTKFVIDAIETAIMRDDINFLHSYKAELELNLKKVNRLLNFEEAEHNKKKEKLIKLIENSSAQNYFIQYHNILNPDILDHVENPEYHANQWIIARIDDFQISTNTNISVEQFKELYEQWRKLKVTE
jgi:hypothetical protein